MMAAATVPCLDCGVELDPQAVDTGARYRNLPIVTATDTTRMIDRGTQSRAVYLGAVCSRCMGDRP